MSEARAKLYINTGVVTAKSDIYNVLRPLLKQTVSYTYYRGTKVTSRGTGWVERIVVDHPDTASYFTPLAICVNLDSFDYLQFDTTSDQLLVYTLVAGNEHVVLELAARPPAPGGPPPRPRAGAGRGWASTPMAMRRQPPAGPSLVTPRSSRATSG